MLILEWGHSVLPQVCQLLLCLRADVEPSQQKSPRWDLTEALLMPWKLSSNLNHGRAGRQKQQQQHFCALCSWVSLGNKLGNCQHGECRETTLKYLSPKPLFNQCSVRTSMPPGCLQSAGRNWKVRWLLLKRSCVLGAVRSQLEALSTPLRP